MKLLWLVAGFFALFISPSQAQERKDVAVTHVLSATVTSSGQPIVLPQKDARIVVSTYDVMPGATLPVHQASLSSLRICLIWESACDQQGNPKRHV
jgi:hypothetical protein